ncbi:MAG: SDR family oxidoreductase [Planctomycetota bacterium]|nr:MAG: SDR family oxidoreductase [Planctomycetota bacterium]
MRVACVTGSSSGIGAATAVALARCGYAIAIHGHKNLAGMSCTADRVIEVTGRNQVRCFSADLRDAGACRDLVHSVLHWRGRIDAWVNNAGADILTGGRWHAPLEQRLEQLWQVDVLATIRLSRLVAEAMVRTGTPPIDDAPLPAIVNMGWDQAALGMEGEAGQLFGTAKSAVEGFTRALAQSIGHRVRVNLIAPGWIRTSWGSTEQGTQWDRRARRESLLGRWGTPEDVADAVAWLVSDQARFINGQKIEVNGGRRFS